MQILIVRHAIAEERITFAATGNSDDQRPLTPKGISRMRKGSQGLKRILPEIQLLAHSPLVRAVQTADIVAEYYPQAQRMEFQELAPSPSPEQVLKRLTSLPSDTTIALVGHEPDLSELIAWLTTGTQEGFINLKKGAACLLETWGPPAETGAQLLWCLAPRQLRQLSQ